IADLQKMLSGPNKVSRYKFFWWRIAILSTNHFRIGDQHQTAVGFCFNRFVLSTAGDTDVKSRNVRSARQQIDDSGSTAIRPTYPIVDCVMACESDALPCSLAQHGAKASGVGSTLSVYFD